MVEDTCIKVGWPGNAKAVLVAQRRPAQPASPGTWMRQPRFIRIGLCYVGVLYSVTTWSPDSLSEVVLCSPFLQLSGDHMAVFEVAYTSKQFHGVEGREPTSLRG